MAAIAAAMSKLDPAKAKEMATLLQNFKNMVEEDTPKALTLQQVYERWNGKKQAGDTLDISEVNEALDDEW